jgi:hypothetical protein
VGIAPTCPAVIQTMQKIIEFKMFPCCSSDPKPYAAAVFHACTLLFLAVSVPDSCFFDVTSCFEVLSLFHDVTISNHTVSVTVPILKFTNF